MPPEQPGRPRWVHSPGPWRRSFNNPDEISYTLADDGTVVAQVWGDANAAIIAAAPEMLALLGEVEERGLKALPEVRALLSRLRSRR